jgi:class 3 adenylate cyclase
MLSDNVRSRLDAMRSAGGFPADMVERFATFLDTAPEDQVFRMSPPIYAVSHGIEALVAADLFLHATAAGILDFSWGVICPGCCSFLITRGALRSLSERRRCEFCRIPVSAALDDNVEVAFTVSSHVRRLRYHDAGSLDMRREGIRIFFSPSVAHDSDFHARLRQSVLYGDRTRSGATTDIALSFPPGAYVLMAPASHSVLHFELNADAPPLLEVDLLDGRTVPDRGSVRTGGTLRLRNLSPQVAGFLVLADSMPPPEARSPDLVPPTYVLRRFLSGKQLITSQSFLELFRAESIPGEGGLELKNITVLFTDLRGSTELYERLGDLRAFDLVRRHFASLREIVGSLGGAVVKTIGDAIMASFAEAAAALDAATSMNRMMADIDPGLSLKIGLHSGPCIAVELNERLDYFGRTVNVASRVQSLAGEREILCTEPVFNAPGSGEVIRRAGLLAQRSEAALKGIAEAVPVFRLQPARVG